MVQWWDGLTLLQQIFGYVAIPATVILVVQTILVLFGLGNHDMDVSGHDVDLGGHGDGHIDGQDGHDGAGDGLALFSIRGIVAFFSVGGWTGIVMAQLTNPAITILVALAAGCAALYVVALIFHWANKLQDSGNLSLTNAVGKTAKVYLTIPKHGAGKVTLTFQGRFNECSAITKAGRDIKTGEMVRVVGLVDENTLIVIPAGADEINR